MARLTDFRELHQYNDVIDELVLILLRSPEVTDLTDEERDKITCSIRELKSMIKKNPEF